NRVRTKSREHTYRVDEMREMFGPLVLTPPLAERTVLQQAQGSARPIHSWPGHAASELAGSFDALLDRGLRTSTMRSRGEARGTPSGGAAAAQQSSPADQTTDAASAPPDAAPPPAAEGRDDAPAEDPTTSRRPRDRH
ncbi:MAG TPA: hypothetical protein VK065_03680, partial [Brevibacterium sp.]|nr:hypothetical protein [Brevibacterium sp.]